MGLMKYIRKLRNLYATIKSIDRRIAFSEENLQHSIITSRRDMIKQRYLLLNQMDSCIGVTDMLYDNKRIIVSLTTYRYRIHETYLVIESLMRQTLKPNKILLWLAEDEFDNDTIPLSLKKMESRGLSIQYCEDIKSYKKLIPTLEQFPNDIVVTADDDALYPQDWLERLYNCYKKHPDEVICTHAHKISYTVTGELVPYRLWNNVEKEESSFSVFPVGIGGVLYPPDILCHDVYNRTLFKDLAPYADDVWFKVMSRLNNVKCRCLWINEGIYNYITLLTRDNDVALSFTNYSCDNDIQIKQVFGKYGITQEAFENIQPNSERLLPEISTLSIENYILFLKHQYAYSLVGKLLRKGMSVLEIGCGEGYGANYLASLGMRVTAIDNNDDVVEHAKRRYNNPNLDFYTYDGTDIPIKDKTFDAVISFQVIEHVKDVTAYMRCVNALLKPNGYYYITTPSRTYRLTKNQTPWNEYHLREYDADGLKNEAKLVFDDAIVLGITAKEDIRNIEIERVRQNKADYNGTKKVLFKPNIFVDKYTVSDFFISNNNVDECLDLLLTNNSDLTNVSV